MHDDGLGVQNVWLPKCVDSFFKESVCRWCRIVETLLHYIGYSDVLCLFCSLKAREPSNEYEVYLQ